MRRLVAVLMTAMLVTSAVGAGMIVNGQSSSVDKSELNVVSLGTDATDDVSVYRIDNGNDESVEVTLSVYGGSQSETVTVGAESSTTVAFDGTGSKTVRLLYNGELAGTTATNPNEAEYVLPGKLTLTSISVDSEDDLAKFRVMNENDEQVTVSYDVYGTNQTGELTVGGESEAFFTVDTSDDGSATVRLLYEDEQVGVKAAGGGEADLGMDGEDVRLTAICTDSEDDLAKFRVTNNNAGQVTVDYDVYGTDQNGTLTLNASETKHFTVETNDDGEATARLLYDGEVVETKASNTQDDCDLGDDGEDVRLVAICTDGEDGLAQFRVDNMNDREITVSYDVAGGDASGELTLNASETKYFTVETNEEGPTTARLFYDGEQVDVKASNTNSECDLGEPNVDSEDISLTAICSDGEDGLSQFRVTNDNDAPVTVEYQKYGSDVTGELTVEANSETFFTVPTNEEGATTVTLDYEGEQVDVKAANPGQCDLGEENDAGDGDDADNGDGDAGDGDDANNGDDADDGDGDAGDGDDANNGDDGMEGEMDAFQIDVAAGDVIETLGDDENDFYGTQGRLLQAQTVLENGSVTGSFMVPTENVTKSLAGCHVSYTPVDYDGETGEVTLSVSVEGDADCESVTLTLAGYELPGDDTTFVRENADGQELVDYRTVTLESGDSGTVTIDLTDDESSDS
jgi:uncharacterized protein YcfL